MDCDQITNYMRLPTKMSADEGFRLKAPKAILDRSAVMRYVSQMRFQSATRFTRLNVDFVFTEIHFVFRHHCPLLPGPRLPNCTAVEHLL